MRLRVAQAQAHLPALPHPWRPGSIFRRHSARTRPYSPLVLLRCGGHRPEPRDSQGPHTVPPYSGTGGRKLFLSSNTYTSIHDPRSKESDLAKIVLAVYNLKRGHLRRLSPARFGPPSTRPRTASLSATTLALPRPSNVYLARVAGK